MCMFGDRVEGVKREWRTLESAGGWLTFWVVTDVTSEQTVLLDDEGWIEGARSVISTFVPSEAGTGREGGTDVVGGKGICLIFFLIR